MYFVISVVVSVLYFVLFNLFAFFFVSRVYGGCCFVDDDVLVCFIFLDVDVDVLVVFVVFLFCCVFDFFGGGIFKIGLWFMLSLLSFFCVIKVWMI